MPLPKKVLTARFQVGSLKQRPSLALQVADVVEIWSHTDSIFVTLLTSLVKAEPIAIAAMLRAIDNQTTQREVVLGAARAVISEDDYRLLLAAVNSNAASRRVRHQFAHHLWGVSDELPDALLSIDPKDHVATVAKWRAWSKKYLEGATGGVLIPPAMQEINLLRPLVSVWKETDLKKAVVEAMRSHSTVEKLAVMAFMGFSSSCDSIRVELLADPLVQVAHRKLS